jgi:chromosome segregation protein
MKKIETAKEKLKKLGNVNTAAEEEYETENERLEFLTTQRDDLLEAKNSLNEAITKINRKARVMFTETFEEIREKFITTFGELFQGGEADLRLSESDDPLEGDVEIFATPQGKRMKNIRLLSGGEKALTAIALLFSIYMVKPSPFCILDEVDAPLDDANVNRFTSLLRRLSERTQFIIITHNKRTMEICDTLYGVTMNEPGVSQMISIELKEI